MNRSAVLLSQKGLNGLCVRTSLNVEAAGSVTAQRHYTLAQYKRLKNKKNWISKDDPNIGPDADFYLPDREQLGLDVKLNQALHKYKIVPAQEAFRNLHLSGLVMLADGKTDKSKALHVPVSGDDFTVYFGERAPAFTPSPKVIQLDQYKQLVKEVKDHLSDTPHIVVHDGAIGSHPSAEVRARIVTDDPAAAVYLHHVLPRISIKDVSEFKHDITVYIVPKFKSSLKAYGVNSERFILADVARGIAIIGGPISSSAIRAGLVAVSQAKFLVDRDVVPVDASIVGVEGVEKPILVFGNHDVALNDELGLQVFGSHNAAWGKEGLVRFFDGVTAPVSKSQKGDFIEDLKGSSRATTRKAATTNIHPHPSAIVLLVNDSSNVLPTISKISAEYVSQFLLAGYTGTASFKPLYSDSITADPHGVSASVGALAKQHNVGVYVVNVSSKDKPLSNAQLSELLKAVASGNTKDAPVLSNVFSNLSPLTSIKGVGQTLDPTKRGWESAALKTEATKLEKSISDYLTSNFPPPPPPQQPAQQQQQQQQQQTPPAAAAAATAAPPQKK